MQRCFSETGGHMPAERESTVRAAYAAYARGDLVAMLSFFDQDLEWTYLDPSVEDPEPQVCHGRREFEIALMRQTGRGLSGELEEIMPNGDRVAVVVRTPGVDAYRARPSDDRSYDVLTVREGRIVAMRAFRDRAEALAFAGVNEE